MPRPQRIAAVFRSTRDGAAAPPPGPCGQSEAIYRTAQSSQECSCMLRLREQAAGTLVAGASPGVGASGADTETTGRPRGGPGSWLSSKARL
mmetsp:Transcript_10790/g.33699  ORF Transcript_10790/g.33699 Transcript_10790/m.33699 type:complete len:92 (-) Transcript_10790:1675-1950(-)